MRCTRASTSIKPTVPIVSMEFLSALALNGRCSSSILMAYSFEHFPRGKGRSGIGLSRKRHNGSNPSSGLHSSKFPILTVPRIRAQCSSRTHLPVCRKSPRQNAGYRLHTKFSCSQDSSLQKRLLIHILQSPLISRIVFWQL
jgi:hypothetical protein